LSRSVSTLLLHLVLWLPLGCGTSSPKPVQWQEAMLRWYDNSSVRPGEPPRQLWEPPEVDLLLKRVGFADAVAVGRARAVTLFTMLNTPKQLAVVFHPEELIYGDLEQLTDDSGDLLLSLDPGDVDFQMALKTYDFLPGSRYLLLLKRQPTRDKKDFILRWSLYNPQPRLVQEIRVMFRWLKEKKKN